MRNGSFRYLPFVIVPLLLPAAGAEAGQWCLADRLVQAAACAGRKCGNRDIQCETGSFPGAGGRDYRYRCGCEGIAYGSGGLPGVDVRGTTMERKAKE